MGNQITLSLMFIFCCIMQWLQYPHPLQLSENVPGQQWVLPYLSDHFIAYFMEDNCEMHGENSQCEGKMGEQPNEANGNGWKVRKWEGTEDGAEGV